MTSTTVAEAGAARQERAIRLAQAAPAASQPAANAPAAPASPAITTEAVPPPAPVRVGLVLPLSGPNARLGRDMLDAAVLAMAEVGDERLVLVPRDDEGTPEGAARAAAAVLEAGSKLVIGPLLATTVEAVAAPARAASVPVIAFSTDRAVAGNGVYLVGFLPSTQVQRVVAHAQVQGAKRFAALAPKNAYGQQVVEDLRRTVQALGAQMGPVRLYEPNEDMKLVIRQLGSYDQRKAALNQHRAELRQKKDEASLQALKRLEGQETLGPPDFDALLIAESGDKLLQMAALLPYFDIDPQAVRMLGTGQWEGAAVRTEPALAGATFAAPPTASRQAFEKRFRDAYGRDPARLASIAYDAGALAAVLGKSGDYSAQRLTQRNGFAGVDGVFRLLDNGLVERGLAVLEVQREGMRVASPAPDSFGP